MRPRQRRTSWHLPLILLCLLLLAVPATAWNEPETFRGVPWGAAEDAMKGQISATCTASPTSGFFGERTCSSSFTVGDVPTKALLWFRQGGFAGVTFTFDPKSFFTIESAFKERYGPPTSTKEESGKSRGGLEFTNVEHEWQGTKVYISLKKYAGKTTDSRALIQTTSEREEQVKITLQRGKKGAGDLCRRSPGTQLRWAWNRTFRMLSANTPQRRGAPLASPQEPPGTIDRVVQSVVQNQPEA